MSRSDPPARSARGVAIVEILCVAVLPILWFTIVNQVSRAAGFFAWFYGADALAADALRKPPLMPSRQLLWIAAIAAPFQVASALAFLAVGVGVPLAEVGITTRNLGRNVLAGLVFAFVFVPGSLGIQQLVLMALEWAGSAPQEHPFTQLGSSGLAPVEWVLLVFGAVVAAPVWEELVYRGLVQQWVMRNGRRGGLVALGLAALLAGFQVRSGWVHASTPLEMAVQLAPVWVLALFAGAYFLIDRRDAAWGGLFASAVLFAWIHVSVWPSPVPLVWLALGLGWLAWRGRSLAGAVVLHAVFNAVACVLLWYSPKPADAEKVPLPPSQVRLVGDRP